MTDPHIREIGRVHSVTGAPVAIGIDYGAVSVAGHTLSRAEAEEFAHLFVAACWEAAHDTHPVVRGHTFAGCSAAPRCVNGPAPHAWGMTCKLKPGASPEKAAREGQ